MKLIISLITVILTVYQPVPSQTDSTPLITADGSVIEPLCIENWCAISPGMFDRYNLSYGDSIYIECNCRLSGIYIIKDTMNPRYEFCDRVDILIGENDPIGVWDAEIYF